MRLTNEPSPQLVWWGGIIGYFIILADLSVNWKTANNNVVSM